MHHGLLPKDSGYITERDLRLQNAIHMHNKRKGPIHNYSGGMQMSSCPICNTPMKRERREIEKGLFAEVDVCPKCQDEWLDLKAHEALYQYYNRKTFKLGGSLAIRIPKDL